MKMSNRTDMYGNYIKGQCHPGRPDGYHLLGNMTQEEFYCLPWKSKIYGANIEGSPECNCAYMFDENGEIDLAKPIPESWGLKPVFVLIHEMRSDGITSV